MDTIDVATRYSSVSINAPAKTASTSSIITLANAVVESCEIVYAPGHVWLIGVRLLYAGVVVLPWNGVGSYIFGDNERLERDIGMYMPGPITVNVSNTDALAHGVIVIFKWHTYMPPVLATPPSQSLIVG